jgi:hypothetical protein
MVVGDFDVMGITLFEAETDPPLVVDSDAVLAFAFSAQGLEPIGSQHHQVLNATRIRQDHQTPLRLPFERFETLDPLTIPAVFGGIVGEALDHTHYVSRIAYGCKLPLTHALSK